MSRGRGDERVDRETRDVGPDTRSVEEWERWIEASVRVLPDEPARAAPGAAEQDGRSRTRDLVHRPVISIDRLVLPGGEKRETVMRGPRVYRLRGSETQLLATIGAFRVVREVDLAAGRPADRAEREILHLTLRGLAQSKSACIDGRYTHVLALTQEGKGMLDDHRLPGADPEQAYYGVRNWTRDVAHDAQVYRVFLTEGREIEAAGGRITRVVLEAELRHDYRIFLTRPEDGHREDAEDFARAYDLAIVDGGVRLPDLRIEYEQGTVQAHRDLEFVTQHYQTTDTSTKARAGFSLYRVGNGTKRGGAPFDPHHLRRIG